MFCTNIITFKVNFALKNKYITFYFYISIQLSIQIPMISENDLAELLFPHTLKDPVTFHRLAQVSKRFYDVSKKKLIRKEETAYVLIRFKRIWTELPNGIKHGLCRGWYMNYSSEACCQLECARTYDQGKLHGLFQGWHPNGQPWYKTNYIQGKRHGLYQEWYTSGKLQFEYNYVHSQLHGPWRGMSEDGKLQIEYNYNQGQLIEN
jgi:hypothetical protein